MADAVNTQIADALIARDLQARRVEADLRREVWAQLALLEADMLTALKTHDPTDFVLLSRRRREVERLMSDTLDPLIRSRYTRIAELLDAALLRLARQEADVVQTIVNDVTEDDTVTALPSDRQLRAGVVHGLFPSAATPTDLSTTGAAWWERQGDSVTQRLRDQLTVSVSLEDSLMQMTQRVRGTSDQHFRDGLMEKARQDASRLLTTQMTNAVSEARVAVAASNATPLMLVHSSMLDGRTSSQCLARHGLKYDALTHEPIGHSIAYLSGVPYHPNCRSSMLTVLKSGGRASDESLTAWLQRQGTAFQDELLGPTRARMWRNGTLRVRNLLDAASGRPLTLEELGV